MFTGFVSEGLQACMVIVLVSGSGKANEFVNGGHHDPGKCINIRGCCVWQQIKLGRACAVPRMAETNNKQLSKPGVPTLYVVLVCRLVNR